MRAPLDSSHPAETNREREGGERARRASGSSRRATLPLSLLFIAFRFGLRPANRSRCLLSRSLSQSPLPSSLLPFAFCCFFLCCCCCCHAQSWGSTYSICWHTRQHLLRAGSAAAQLNPLNAKSACPLSGTRNDLATLRTAYATRVAKQLRIPLLFPWHVVCSMI